MRAKPGVQVLRCCIPNYRVAFHENRIADGCVRVAWKQLPVSEVFGPGDSIVSLCPNCEHRRGMAGATARSLWEVIDQDGSLAFPDYRGMRVTLQDCWRTRDRPRRAGRPAAAGQERQARPQALRRAGPGPLPAPLAGRAGRPHARALPAVFGRPRGLLLPFLPGGAAPGRRGWAPPGQPAVPGPALRRQDSHASGNPRRGLHRGRARPSAPGRR